MSQAGRCGLETQLRAATCSYLGRSSQRASLRGKEENFRTRPDEAELGSPGKKGSHRLKPGFLSKRSALEKNNSHPSVNVDFSGRAMLKCLSGSCTRDFSGSQIRSQRVC